MIGIQTAKDCPQLPTDVYQLKSGIALLVVAGYLLLERVQTPYIARLEYSHVRLRYCKPASER